MDATCRIQTRPELQDLCLADVAGIGFETPRGQVPEVKHSDAPCLENFVWNPPDTRKQAGRMILQQSGLALVRARSLDAILNVGADILPLSIPLWSPAPQSQ